MLREYITLSALLIFITYILVSGIVKNTKDIRVTHTAKYYLKNTVFCIIALSGFYLLNKNLYHQIDFSLFHKGFHINEAVLSSLYSFFFVSFFLACLPFLPDSTIYSRKNISEAKEVFGLPVTLMPSDYKQVFLFLVFIVTGVLFEELLFRQFLFYSFHRVFHLDGDILVIITSLLFSAGHFYQGFRGIILQFVTGFLLGKIFMLTENFIYPFVLHLFLNLTVVVYAIRRIHDLRKIEKAKEEQSAT